MQKALQRTSLREVPLRHQVAQPHGSALLAPDHVRALRILCSCGELSTCAAFTTVICPYHCHLPTCAACKTLQN